jgi:hypothetical protein
MRCSTGATATSKNAGRDMLELEGGPQHGVGPGMDGDRARPSIVVEARHVAGRIVEAHQVMHLGYHLERRVDRRARH